MMVAAAGERAALGFIDFFTANIRNPNTRATYTVAVRGFFTWLDERAIRELSAIRTAISMFAAAAPANGSLPRSTDS